jgi:hypothetical protein
MFRHLLAENADPRLVADPSTSFADLFGRLLILFHG